MNRKCKLVLTSATLLAVLVLPAFLSFSGQALAAQNTLDNEPLPVFLPVRAKLLPHWPLPCYGPHLTANISKTQVVLNEVVTAQGMICPPEPNQTIEVTFVRPDYTFINQQVHADDQTGEFRANQTLDMAGFWNVFFLHNHITDRLFINVTDPAGTLPPQTAQKYPPPPDSDVIFPIGLVAIGVGVAVMAFSVWKRDKTRKISSLRLSVQIAFILLIFIGMFLNMPRLPLAPNSELAQHEYLVGTDIVYGALPDGLPIPVFACYYACGRTVACPLWQIQTSIYPFWNAGHGWAVNYELSGFVRIAFVFGIVVAAAVILGRFWCGWICPFGLYIDLMTRLRKVLKIKHRSLSPAANERLHQLSYVILAAMLILSVLFGAQAIFGTQLVAGTENGGFTYTYFSAPFCQVCPMKPLCLLTESSTGVVKPEWTFATTTGAFYQLGYYVTSLNVAILIIVTATAFFFRRSWCRICPLGGLIGLFNRFAPFKWVSGVRLEKSEEKCKKCGVCKRVCPTQVTSVYDQKGGDVANSQCIMCLRCVEMCPHEDALKFKFVTKTVLKSRNWLNKD